MNKAVQTTIAARTAVAKKVQATAATADATVKTTERSIHTGEGACLTPAEMGTRRWSTRQQPAPRVLGAGCAL